MINKSGFFDFYYNNAEVNSIVIMSTQGIILEVNNAFTNNFGYTSEDLYGRNFRELFTATDKNQNIPEHELDNTLKKGQADDEGFIVDKNGNEVWCTGECILTSDENGEKYIVKDVINLQAKKQINLFLNSTEELLDRIFNASKDIPMMILDGSMKIQNVNKAFLDFFEIKNAPASNSSLSNLNHSFWNKPEIRSEISKVIVTNTPLKRRQFIYQTESGEEKIIALDSKIIHRQPETGRKIFVIVEELTTSNQ